MNKFSKNLKELRVFSKLSQKELATMLNVSDKTIAHWESGYTEPSIDMLMKLKDALKASYDELIE